MTMLESIGRIVGKLFKKKTMDAGTFKLAPPSPQKVIDTTKWKDKTIEGSDFPDDPYRTDLLKPNQYVLNEYLPAFDKAVPGAAKGLKLLCTIMTMIEGFRPGTRSYKTRNPGNIANTDDGSNHTLPTLEDGIKLQVQYLQDVAAGKKKAYPLGKPINMPPDFSKEIQNNTKNYMVTSGDLPGYKFIYDGRISQFFKIYSTLSRVRNDYPNRVMSYFEANGLFITPDSKLQDIISLT